MNGLRVVGNCDLDFTATRSRPSGTTRPVPGATLQAYSGEKGYQPNREEELFRMMQQGALISRDGHLYPDPGSPEGDRIAAKPLRADRRATACNPRPAGGFRPDMLEGLVERVRRPA